MCSYATLYKEYFIDLSAKIKNYGCFYQDKNLDKTKNIIIQTIQILGYFNTSTFESYVLKVINEKSREDQYNILKILNTYLIRNYIVDGKIDNNYNKEAAKLTNGAETIEHFMKMNSLDDNKIKMTLSNKVENNPAKLVLYWIELYHNYKRNGDKKYSRLVCNYQLEHVMPQKWEENWKIQYPEKDNDGNELSQEEKDKIKKELNEKRYHAIYQIGNMTLLIGTKNDELGNASFENKINGFKCKNGKFISGLKDSSTLIISKDILDKNEWSEDTIQDRTDSIYEAFISIWPVDPKIFLD